MSPVQTIPNTTPRFLRKLHEDLDPSSIKHHVGEFLESRKVEVLIIVLIVLDVLLLGVEQGIDSHMLCIQGTVVPGLPPADLRTIGDQHASSELQLTHDSLDLWTRQPNLGPSFLAPGTPDGDEYENGGAAAFMVDHEDTEHAEHAGHEDAEHAGHAHHEAALVCETQHGPSSHEIVHRCHQASITILCIFLVEILGKLWVNFSEFIRSPLEMLDLTVVSVSLFVDVVIIPMVHDPNARGQVELVVALLIVCRAWRVVRIFHGAFAVVHSRVEQEEKLNHRIEELEEALADAQGVDVETLRRSSTKRLH